MSKKGLLIAIAVAVALVTTVVTLTIWLLDQPVTEAPEEAEAPIDQPVTIPLPSPDGEVSDPATRRIRVTLYMLSESGTELAVEDREIALADNLQDQAKQVLRELLAGSRQGRSSAVPPGVQLRELFITPQGLAFVDLSQELVSNHIGGSRAEELTVYSLSNTLIANFPAVKRVQFLVEGREVPTLAGHFDLTQPYGRGPRRLEQTSGR
ncbi:MAG: GerMN domain-containing protein [Vicinamibacteria bacterium]